MEYDIGLIRVSSDIEFSQPGRPMLVGSIALVQRDFDYDVKRSVNLVGLGYIEVTKYNQSFFSDRKGKIDWYRIRKFFFSSKLFFFFKICINERKKKRKKGILHG